MAQMQATERSESERLGRVFEVLCDLLDAVEGLQSEASGTAGPNVENVVMINAPGAGNRVVVEDITVNYSPVSVTTVSISYTIQTVVQTLTLLTIGGQFIFDRRITPDENTAVTITAPAVLAATSFIRAAYRVVAV